MYFCYVIQSAKSGRLYVGSTQDVEFRVADHNRGHVTATRGRGPWRVVYTEGFETRSQAICREQEIKSWKSRGAIEALIEG